jgi:hypothetical protein
VAQLADGWRIGRWFLTHFICEIRLQSTEERQQGFADFCSRLFWLHLKIRSRAIGTIEYLFKFISYMLVF